MKIKERSEGGRRRRETQGLEGGWGREGGSSRDSGGGGEGGMEGEGGGSGGGGGGKGAGWKERGLGGEIEEEVHHLERDAARDPPARDMLAQQGSRTDVRPCAC